MRKLFSLLLLLGTITSIFPASSGPKVKCNWLESEEHSPGFFRPAHITMTVGEEEIYFVEDTFLFRTYEPCWVSTFSSCAFGFSYNDPRWSIVEKTKNHEFTLSTPGFYWDATLYIQFEKDIYSLKRGQATKARLSGDDGDGVMFENEYFLCQRN